MGMYVVNTDILNIRSSPSADSDDNYVGFLRKGEKIWLEDNTVTGTIPADSSSNQWRIYGENYVLDEWVFREGSYEAKKQEFVNNPSLMHLHNGSNKEEEWNVDWGFVDLEMWKVWETYKTKGKGVTIAVIDTGIDVSTLGTLEQQVTCYDMTFDTPKKILPNNDPGNTKHGTNCAGIMISNSKNLLGVCPDANLIMLKIMTDNGTFKKEYMLKAFEFINELNVDVVSCSYQFTTYTNNQTVDMKSTSIKRLHEAIKTLYRKNVVVVAAVGNGNSFGYTTNTIPALFPECISVGGINKKHNRSEWSAISDFITIVAPGQEIRMSTANNTDSGTSYATPCVAGLIALAKSVNNSINNDTLYKHITDTAYTATIQHFNKKEHGYGILNPISILKKLKITI